MTLTLLSPRADEIDALTDVLNRSFSDYVIPAHFSAAAVEAMIARDSIDLGQSCVAQADTGGPLLGVALTAIRPGAAGPRSRVAAMGVAPEGRRQGVARALLDRQLADARARGSAALQLECFAHNTRALRLYESSGFAVTRRLLSFDGQRGDLRLPAAPTVELRRADPTALPDVARRCAEAAPSWQLEPVYLQQIAPPREAWAIHAPGEETPAGFAVFAAVPDSGSARIVQFGVLPERRRCGLASAALAAWLAANPAVTTLNIPPLLPDDMLATRAWLTASGFLPGPADQVEMFAALA